MVEYYVQDNEVIVVKESTRLIVEGTKKVKRIDIETNDPVEIVGDTLIVETAEHYCAAIGVQPNFCMSGRWQIGYYELDLKISLNKLITKTGTPEFSIGVYGDFNSPHDYLIGDGDYSGVSGLNVVMVVLPDARRDSTKMNKEAVYLTQVGAHMYTLQQQRLLCCSDYPLNGGIIGHIEEYFRTKKFTWEPKDLADVGSLVGTISSLVNDKEPCLDNKDVYKEILQIVKEKEIALWGNRHPKYTLCDRAIICLNDRFLSFFTDGEFSNFLDNLNLTKELHDVYFPGTMMREYRVCQSYMYGAPMWDEVTNDFIDGAIDTMDLF